MKNPLPILAALAVTMPVGSAWGEAPAGNGAGDLKGAWRAQMHFAAGAFADVKDLEFMYVYNAGGTLTESSNYDAAPPVAPAYGIWRRTGPNHYQSKYIFYITKPPASFQDITKGGGWPPDGHGVFTEDITVAADGNSYSAQVTYVAYDVHDKPADGGGTGTATGTRITF